MRTGDDPRPVARVLNGPLDKLAHRWRDERERYHQDDALVRADKLIDRFLADLKATAESPQHALLNLKDAAKYSGYDRRTIKRWLDEGTLTDYGQKNAPQVGLIELRIKPGHLPPGTDLPRLEGTSKRDIVRSAVESERSP